MAGVKRGDKGDRKAAARLKSHELLMAQLTYCPSMNH